ncbi:PAS domain-containing protein [Aquibaculum sediminis]|uniref:PAS domain-containing protein n=1 Tax=Aquibaculum sediminis TaxID=3231907 RepID=UPI00345538CB
MFQKNLPGTAAAEGRSTQASGPQEAGTRISIAWTAQADGRINYISPNFREITGQTAPGHNAESWLETLHPEDRERAERGWQEAVASRQIYADEFRLQVGALGRHRRFLFTAHPVRDVEGKLTHWHGSAIDIQQDEHRQSSAPMRPGGSDKVPNTGDRSEQLDAFLDAIPAPIWAADADGRVYYANGILFEWLGYPREEFDPRHWLSLVHADDHPNVERDTRDAVQAGENFAVEMRLRHGDGSYRWYVDTGAPLKDERGRVLKYYGTLTDIDRLKAASEALRDSEARQRAIIDNEPECVKLVAADGTLLDMNPAGLRLIEANSREDVIGTLDRCLIHPQDRERYKALHRKAMNGHTGQASFRMIGLKGTTRWMSSHATPMYDANGHIYAVLSVARDVTEQRHFAELRELEATVLDAVSAGLPLSAILETLTETVDRLQPGVRSSVQLVDGGHLHHGAGPHLPEAFNRAVDGLPVREGAGSCGTAAARRRQVVVGDTQASPLWRDYREIAKAHNLAACWSTPVLDSDGEVLATFAMYYDHNTRPTPSEQGFIARIGQFLRVAIERTRQHQQLRESEANLRSVYDLVPVSIWEEDWSGPIAIIKRLRAQGISDVGAALLNDEALMEEALSGTKILNVNATAVSMFGAYDRMHLMESFGKVFAGEVTRKAAIKAFDALARGARHFEAENRLHDISGRPFDVLARFSLPDIERGDTRALVTEMDITERKYADDRFRVIAQATSDVVWDRELPSGKVWYSDGLRSVFGYPPEALGESPELWTELIHPEDRGRVLAAAHEAFAGGKPYRESYRVARADGSWAHVRDQGFLLHDASGKPVRMIGSVVDISEQHKLEEQLREAQRLDAIGHLTGGIAHDFNNLLTVILGNAELLSESLADNPDLARLADMTGSAALKGAELTARLLAFARKQPLNPKAVDVNALVQGLEEMLRRTLGETIEFQVLPAEDDPAALVDAPQLESALLNLCINARDAMPNGGKLTIATQRRSVETEDRQQQGPKLGTYVLLTISDTGTGMDEPTRLRAFEPFFTTKDVGEGSGLGLSMVYGFAKQSRGHVALESRLGRGTRVRLYLPAAEAMETEEAESADSSVESSAKGKRILLVEDDTLVRRHVERQLTGLGYLVTGAANGPAALDIIRSGASFDLLFTDMVMPGGMSGDDLVRAAREHLPQLPVLLTTGYSEEAMSRAEDCDLAMLPKPYRLQELVAKLNEVLSGA